MPLYTHACKNWLQAPSARLDAYLQGRLPKAAPAGNLPEQLDQNLQLLQILGAEMRGLHLKMDTALQVRGGARDKGLCAAVAGRPAWESHGGGLIMSGPDSELQGHMEAEGLVGDAELAADSAGQALLMAATIDALTRENEIVVRKEGFAPRALEAAYLYPRSRHAACLSAVHN